MTLRLQPRPAPLRGRVANSGGRWDRAQARAARGRGAVASLLGALAAADQPGAWAVHREAGGSSCARHPQAVAGGPLSPSAPCLGIQAGGRQLRSAPPKASRPSGRESSKRVRLPWREGPGRAWGPGTWREGDAGAGHAACMRPLSPQRPGAASGASASSFVAAHPRPTPLTPAPSLLSGCADTAPPDPWGKPGGRPPPPPAESPHPGAGSGVGGGGGRGGAQVGPGRRE